MRARKAFTLIELMIVVAILGILAAVAIPKAAEIVAMPKLKKMGYSEHSVRGFIKYGRDHDDYYGAAKLLDDKDLQARFRKWEAEHPY